MSSDLVCGRVTNGRGKQVDSLDEPRGRTIGTGIGLGVANVDTVSDVVWLRCKFEGNGEIQC